jgi:hypothetical protein
MSESVINLSRTLFVHAMASGTNLGSLSEQDLRDGIEQITKICFTAATIFEDIASQHRKEALAAKPPLAADITRRP